MIDRKDLLVKIKTPGLNENDDDEDDSEQKQLNLRESTFDMLNDTSSSSSLSTADDLYADVGKQRIKIKGDEVKIKGRSKIIDRNFFLQTNNLEKTSRTEPDLTSFDFLNEYEE